MQISGFALVEKSTGAVIDYWDSIPQRLQLPSGDVVFCADQTWSNNEYDIRGHAWDVADPPSPPPRAVRKSTIIRRLNDAGLLEAASRALNSDLYTRERWYAPDRPSIYADDLEALALLRSIGADATVILGPEE